jgi:hypothetical protein
VKELRPIIRQLALVALATGGLYLKGRGLLEPPMAHPSLLDKWWEDEGPIVAVFSALRLVLLGAGVYWMGLLVLAGALSCLGGRRAIAVFSRSGLLGAKRAAGLAVGASAMGSILVVAASPSLASPGPAGPAPVLTNLSTAPASAPLRVGRSSRPVVTGLGPSTRTEPPPATAARRTVVRPTAARRTVVPAAPRLFTAPAGYRPERQPRQWIVQPGDDLWSIAKGTLEVEWGSRPSDPQVASYWREVIQTNRDRLPDPTDPSLLFPADIIYLPPLPPPPPA